VGGLSWFFVFVFRFGGGGLGGFGGVWLGFLFCEGVGSVGVGGGVGGGWGWRVVFWGCFGVGCFFLWGVCLGCLVVFCCGVGGGVSSLELGQKVGVGNYYQVIHPRLAPLPRPPLVYSPGAPICLG